MEARIKNPAIAAPGAMQALLALGKAAEASAVPKTTHKMVHLRASQINGCAFCVDMHSRELREAGESAERIASIAAWRHSPLYNQAERAALALTEALTRIADQADPVPDALWSAVAEHYSADELSSLILSISTINVWNRINMAIAQPAGAKWN
ncbi:carboxymuconolactone decarboxylase family protein [Arthrobacter russicus]|jgi:AhpD family alkylhydroperoxidase|uniref:AhpD family alkylhydroperoxidase n=1 Tax=Arthrobacter russicus TaxID=172040 RepID=A0ABU1JF39_9MICC|nr:carboxymuconolactone decarboxylase family protein [Arthrobacter russicus]MDR6271042.1 AhpD family alkylhydroperoxidase [Arthrobacter russicus]